MSILVMIFKLAQDSHLIKKRKCKYANYIIDIWMLFLFLCCSSAYCNVNV